MKIEITDDGDEHVWFDVPDEVLDRITDVIGMPDSTGPSHD